MIAAGFGWELTRTEDVVRPVLAESAVRTPDIEIAAGQALGVEQIGRAFIGEEEKLHLVFRAAVGQEGACDRVTIRGVPQIVSEISGGVPGDGGTCAILVNAVAAVTRARPGLRHMADTPPVTWSTS